MATYYDTRIRVTEVLQGRSVQEYPEDVLPPEEMLEALKGLELYASPAIDSGRGYSYDLFTWEPTERTRIHLVQFLTIWQAASLAGNKELAKWVYSRLRPPRPAEPWEGSVWFREDEVEVVELKPQLWVLTPGSSILHAVHEGEFLRARCNVELFWKAPSILALDVDLLTLLKGYSKQADTSLLLSAALAEGVESDSATSLRRCGSCKRFLNK